MTTFETNYTIPEQLQLLKNKKRTLLSRRYELTQLIESTERDHHEICKAIFDKGYEYDENVFDRVDCEEDQYRDELSKVCELLKSVGKQIRKLKQK